MSDPTRTEALEKVAEAARALIYACYDPRLRRDYHPEYPALADAIAVLAALPEPGEAAEEADPESPYARVFEAALREMRGTTAYATQGDCEAARIAAREAHEAWMGARYAEAVMAWDADRASLREARARVKALENWARGALDWLSTGDEPIPLPSELKRVARELGIYDPSPTETHDQD